MHADAKSASEHLRRHYGLVGSVQRVPRGRADNYRVSAASARWLFKVFQTEYTLPRIDYAADFVSFVARSGYPAREFAPSLDGARVIPFEQRAAVLIPWIDGHTPEANSVTFPSALRQMGALCGRLHRLGEQYPHAQALEYTGSTRSLAYKRAALLRLTDAGGEIAAEARARVEILDALGDELERSHARARRGVIHGDFSAAHVVFRGDHAVGVIDVLGDMYLPGWELMRAFFQSVPVADDVERPWRAFIGGYASEHSITREEIETAYDTYLLQLTSSTYGLREPLDEQRELKTPEIV